MKETDKKEQLVFGLDIGTRSVVGTVGFMKKDRFTVVCQHVHEHETRAMLDGQIHDIGRVAETIKAVKEECEASVGQELKQVCIAAAGRVLQTLDTHVDMVFGEERETLAEDVSNLMSLGIEKAYREFVPKGNEEVKYYCVGYSVVKYYLNKYAIGNLVGHKAKQISADLIATFLPDDVVDGLYRAVEMAGLEVVNLTLEPIAAISVAIPEKFRMLNIALVDVGAGTSDISITKDGSITAYGMIPMAGDVLTDTIAQHCLVDFDMAEKIKRESGVKDTVEFEDILGLPQTISSKEVLEAVEDNLNEMTTKVSDEIKRLNGDKPVSAVFVVGGGGLIKGYTDKLAAKLGIQSERVALRGSEVMGRVDFLNDDALKTSLMVTPVGICLNYYEHNNNLIYVTFNGKRMKMYDNGHVIVIDVAIQAGFPNDGLFPKRGKAITYSVNGKSKILKGEIGEAAVITINDQDADISQRVSCNDKIVIKESTAGVRARIRISSLPEFKKQLKLVVDGKNLSVPRPVFANGKLVTADYEIKDDDRIEIADYCLVEELLTILDLPATTALSVNHEAASGKTRIYENFTVSIGAEPVKTENGEDSEPVDDEEGSEGVENVSKPETESVEAKEDKPKKQEKPQGINPLTITVNGEPVTLTGKSDYIFVDVFDFIDFDLKNPKGSGVVTNHNGNPANYMDAVNEGDALEIYWKD